MDLEATACAQQFWLVSALTVYIKVYTATQGYIAAAILCYELERPHLQSPRLRPLVIANYLIIG